MSRGLYVQYGCAWDAPDSWLNFDSSPTLRIERLPMVGRYLSARLKGNRGPFPDNVRYGDIVKGLPVDDGSCAGVYCSHVLEHLSLDDCAKALVNTRRLLQPGGIFRLVMPDISVHVDRYAAAGGPDAALELMRRTGLGEEVRDRGIRGMALALFGNSRHRWMWDYPSMERACYDAGFGDVRRAVFGDSADGMFSRVERRDRWESCLGIECRV